MLMVHKVSAAMTLMAVHLVPVTQRDQYKGLPVTLTLVDAVANQELLALHVILVSMGFTVSLPLVVNLALVLYLELSITHAALMESVLACLGLLVTFVIAALLDTTIARGLACLVIVILLGQLVKN